MDLRRLPFRLPKPLLKPHSVTSTSWPRGIVLAGGGLVAFLALPAVLVAQVSTETQFVLNSFAFLVWGALVMWMCAGFTMLEAGSVRSKNASVICMKNIGLYSIAGLMYFVVGFEVMYGGGAYFGNFVPFAGSTPQELELLATAGQVEAVSTGSGQQVIGTGRAETSNWFFQMVFVATTASIVSGSLAERVNLWAFFVFTAVLTGIIYPIVGAWTWGGGWLAELGFVDFAGSTIVHSTGGWAALAGVMVVGPRWGKFKKDGSIKMTPPSNIPAVTLGVFILWLGWFGFNGGSWLAMGGVTDAIGMSNVIVNTNFAAAAGVVTAILTSRRILGRLDLFATLNGAIAGLVAITAGPNIGSAWWAILIGAVGAVVCMFGVRILEKYRIDDVVGAVPAHLFAGTWGTLATCIAAGGNVLTQLYGIVSVGAFVFGVSFALWLILERTMGVRVSREVEEIGQDAAELGIDAYPEFVLNIDPDQGEDYRD